MLLPLLGVPHSSPWDLLGSSLKLPVQIPLVFLGWRGLYDPQTWVLLMIYWSVSMPWTKASLFPSCLTNLISILLCAIQKAGAAPFPWYPPWIMRWSLHILFLYRSEIVGWWLKARSGWFVSLLVIDMTWRLTCVVFGCITCGYQTS